MESNITITKKDGVVIAVLFLTDADIKEHGWTPDTEARSYQGISWHPGPDDFSYTVQAERVDGGSQWTYKIAPKSWLWYQEDEVVVYSIRWDDGDSAHIDLNKFYAEDKREIKVYKFNATNVFKTSGLIRAASKEEAEAILQSALGWGDYCDDLLQFSEFSFSDSYGEVTGESNEPVKSWDRVLDRPEDDSSKEY